MISENEESGIASGSRSRRVTNPMDSLERYLSDSDDEDKPDVRKGPFGDIVTIQSRPDDEQFARMFAGAIVPSKRGAIEKRNRWNFSFGDNSSEDSD
ncbi:uncharacterized protein LOC142350353 isoform X2 [Convolutriloba macropyga]|uniref:uncharacterized protein LOC142350353 isoform X2 n=1 Tax=Convolutriloba macropyga TaxID=536237 RepID=UPI003F51FB86